MITSEQIRAARAMLRWEQKDLAEASKISLPAIKRLETIPGPLAAQARTVEALQTALEEAGIEFTNGGLPGVRVNAVWMLHQVASRASMEKLFELLGKGSFGWKIARTPTGLECQNANGEVLGVVLAGRADHPAPTFTPEIGELHFPDRATPDDLHKWVTAIVTLHNQRGARERFI